MNPFCSDSIPIASALSKLGVSFDQVFITFFLFRCAGHPTVQYGPSQFRGLQSWRALLFRSPRHLPDSSAIRLRLIGWEQPMKNDFLRVTRFSVTVALYTCRPDLVGFVNGPPLVVIELKRFGGSSPPSAFVK